MRDDALFFFIALGQTTCHQPHYLLYIKKKGRAIGPNFAGPHSCQLVKGQVLGLASSFSFFLPL